jgi:hypothetical protein
MPDQCDKWDIDHFLRRLWLMNADWHSPWVCLASIVILLVVVLLFGDILRPKTAPRRSEIDTPPSPTEIGHVTAANVARIRKGMKRDEVDTLLGAEHVLGEGGTLAHPDVLYGESTEGQLAAVVWVIFDRHDRVIAKSTPEAPGKQKEAE